MVTQLLPRPHPKRHGVGGPCRESPKNVAMETTVWFIATAFALALPLTALKEPETVGRRNCREEKGPSLLANDHH